MTSQHRGGTGFTILETLVAALLTSVVAGGTLMAFVSAARMVREESSPASVEAASYAQQTVERFRNKVATDDTWLSTQAGVWGNDSLPGSGGSESILTTGASRRYCIKSVSAANCGGLDGCFAIRAQVCWNGAACPAGGAC